MSPAWGQLGIVAATISLVMMALWWVQWRRQDASLVDAGWAGGIGLGALLLCWLGEGEANRRLLVAIMGGLWSLRLTTHLVRDRLLGKPEDGRYQMLRAQWGSGAQPRFFVFFQFQAVLVAFFVLPFLVIAADVRPLGGIGMWLGVAIWMLAIAGESLADHQLARWRQDPANHGRTCRAGLWRYSRHPNYFCEWLLWWAYVAIAAGTIWVWLAVLVPVVLLILLLTVTGIPYTEKRALASRGDDYRDYQRTTSPFIPWFPRVRAASPKEPS